MTEENINPYKEAYKRGLITHKDYLVESDGLIFDEDGVKLDFINVYHHKNSDRFVGYYIPDGFKSIRIYFNPKMGLHSLLKYYNKVCFDIAFLNKEKDFDDLFSYANAISKYMFVNYDVRKDEDVIKNILTKGLETNEDDYKFNNRMRKYYFTDNNLSGDEKRHIALINTNKNRSKTTRVSVEEAIEYFIQGNKYISSKDIAEFLRINIKTLNRNLTQEDRDRIKQRNIELTGFPTQNEYVKAKNIDKVIDSYIKLKSNNSKPNGVNISKDTGIHRVTVCKILNEEEIFNEI